MGRLLFHVSKRYDEADGKPGSLIVFEHTFDSNRSEPRVRH